jgi:hypothetical protein
MAGSRGHGDEPSGSKRLKFSMPTISFSRILHHGFCHIGPQQFVTADRPFSVMRMCNSFAENVTTSVSTRFELRRVQGRQVMNIVDMKVDFDIQGMSVQFDNLFNGNKVLGECPRDARPTSELGASICNLL